jgi:hypothetical protein
MVHLLLIVIIPLIWLVVAAFVVAACQVAASADRLPRLLDEYASLAVPDVS